MYVFFFLTVLSAFAFERSLPQGKSGQVIEREGYTLQYNSDCKTPHWVSYRMRASDLEGTVKRTNNFRPDPEIRGPQAQLSDYKRSGYDRGHMARAGLFKKTKKLMSETFVLSNIVPQHSFMNQQGAWRKLEDFEYAQIIKRKDVHIVTGPVVGPNDQRIGASEVCVPEYIFKVLYHQGSKHQAIAFIIPNFRTELSYESYAISVDELEEITGIDFFPELEDRIENQVEKTFSLSDWK